MKQHRTTADGGESIYAPAGARRVGAERVAVKSVVAAVARLVHERRRLAHRRPSRRFARWRGSMAASRARTCSTRG